VHSGLVRKAHDQEGNRNPDLTSGFVYSGMGSAFSIIREIIRNVIRNIIGNQRIFPRLNAPEEMYVNRRSS